MIHVGIAFTGDISETHGFCTEVPQHGQEVLPPETCNNLDICCSKFVNSPATYDECLIDSFGECCEIDDTNESCCDVILETKCTDEGFQCSQGECCDEIDFTCYTCPESSDCGKYFESYFFFTWNPT
jgi:hypothetical protein